MKKKEFSFRHYLELLSKNVPYRKTKVEAFALSDDEVQFVTGINYHKGQEIVARESELNTLKSFEEFILKYSIIMPAFNI